MNKLIPPQTFLAFLAFLASLAGPALAGPLPFGPGEQLTYSLKLSVAKVAEFRVELFNHAPVGGHKALRAEGWLKTTAPFKWKYPVEDRVESLMRVDGLKSLSFQMHIQEGTHQKHVKADFFREKLKESPHDFLSLIYALRAAPLAVGHVAKVKIWSEKGVIDFPLIVSGIEKVKSGAGKRECFVLKPVNQLAIKGHPVEIEIAISNDAERLLVRFYAKASIAKISGTLTKVVRGRPLS